METKESNEKKRGNKVDTGNLSDSGVGSLARVGGSVDAIKASKLVSATLVFVGLHFS